MKPTYTRLAAALALGALCAASAAHAQDLGAALRGIANAAGNIAASASGQTRPFPYTKAMQDAVAQQCVSNLAGLQQQAQAGSAQAQTDLGWCHEYGVGTAKNARQAAEWYEKAAAQGHAGSQAQLGLMYDTGMGGLAKNEQRAAQLYQQAASAGDPTGQFYLGMSYAGGAGALPKNGARAAEWFAKAADQGHVRAQTQLGKLYYLGDGVPKDINKGAELWSKSAEQGDKGAKDLLAKVTRPAPAAAAAGGGFMGDGGQADIPKAAAHDAALEAQMLRLSGIYKDGRTPVKAILKSSDWTIGRNAAGQITERRRTAYIIFRMPDGSHRLVDLGFRQLYQGGGRYGALQQRGVGMLNKTVNYR